MCTSIDSDTGIQYVVKIGDVGAERSGADRRAEGWGVGPI